MNYEFFAQWQQKPALQLAVLDLCGSSAFSLDFTRSNEKRGPDGAAFFVSVAAV
jgi:hypothetical protein